MDQSKSDENEQKPPQPVQDEVVLVGTLLASSLQAPEYRVPENVATELIGLLVQHSDDCVPQPFLDGLQCLISRYRIYRSQDNAMSLSEADGLNYLITAYEHLKAFRDACQKAWQHKPTNIRLRWAESTLKAEDAKTETRSEVKVVQPQFIPPLMEYLDEVQRLLQRAASPAMARNNKGGRPTNDREVGFVHEFAAHSRKHFPALSIREQPLNQVLEKSLEQVGWYHTGIRHLVDKVAPPTPRK